MSVYICSDLHSSDDLFLLLFTGYGYIVVDDTGILVVF